MAEVVLWFGGLVFHCGVLIGSQLSLGFLMVWCLFSLEFQSSLVWWLSAGLVAMMIFFYHFFVVIMLGENSTVQFTSKN